jgi:nucleoid-associated protein EbfC
MFKGIGNLASLMKQAQEMQGRVSELQDSLGKLRVEASAGGGMVTVEATGQQKIIAIRIDPSLLDNPDGEMIEDLLTAAVNQALDKSREAASNRMSELTAGLTLPGLSDALSKMGMGGNSDGATDPPSPE